MKKASASALPPKAEPRLHRQRQPPEMAVDDWQRALRRQFGREQAFRLENLGSEPVFSTFRVHNDAAGSHHEVVVRGATPGDNSCSCLDFRTNELGTCKHLEFTLAKLAARRGGRAALKRGAQPRASEIHLRHGAERVVCWRPGSDCPPRLLQRAAALFDGERLLPARYPALDAFVAAARRSGHELTVRDDVLAHVAAWRDARRREQVFAQAFPRGASPRALARLVKTRLYPYQAEGALFAARAGRALIGDDMGLGKTVQAIAAAELMARHLGVRRVLVVCPVSLKHQWQREFERFSGRRAHVVQGLRPERQRHWREEAFAHIVNYEVLARDLDLIHALDPELLIVDEAQRVKNWNTVAARALRRIDAPYALVLTGTPLENRLEELIAIVQLVDQHRLGPTWRLLHEHQLRDDSGRVVGYAGLDRLAATLAPVMLRRRKSEVLSQLPERIDNTLLLPMTPQQRVHHDENGAIVSRIVKRWRATGFLSDSDQLRLTCALQNMRMACNSTWLLDRETDHGTKADELMTLLEELLADPAAKAVVFSQWVRTHEILVPRLERRGIGHVLFHGGVPGERRGALVDRFNQDADCRVFLSTDAGGVGLNLQHAAAVVVNMDQPWNPAVLEQRIGRVHRMGQKRSVQVVNLVAQGSIEESMLGLLAFKKSLFAGVLDGGAGEVTLQGSRLARFMKAVDEATRGVPAAEADIGADVNVDAKEAVAEPPVHAAALPPQPVELGAVAPEGDAVEACAPAPVAAGTAGAPGVPTAAPGSAPDAWRPLLDAGLALLAQLAAAAEAPPGAASPWVQSDPAGGARFLRLPLPEPGTLRRVADALAALADRLPAAARPEDPA